MKIPEHMLNKLIQFTDISQLVRETDSVKMNWAQCPFCQSKASVNISEKHQVYHCFSCGDGGGVIKWVMSRHTLDFEKAVDFLAERGMRLTASPAPALAV